MADLTQVRKLERLLSEQLRRDRGYSHRCEPGPDDTIIVTPTGSSYGLAWMIERETGESVREIMDRVGNEDG